MPGPGLGQAVLAQRRHPLLACGPADRLGAGPLDGEPLDVTGVRTVAFGALMFLGAGLGLLPSYDWLRDTDREWWLWTCGAGFGLGVFGVGYCLRRARSLARRAASPPSGA